MNQFKPSISAVKEVPYIVNNPKYQQAQVEPKREADEAPMTEK